MLSIAILMSVCVLFIAILTSVGVYYFDGFLLAIAILMSVGYIDLKKQKSFGVIIY